MCAIKQMEQFVPVLLRARKELEEFQAERAQCLKLQSRISGRKVRAAVANLLVCDLSAFRLRADNLLCVVADVCGDRAFSELKLDSAVDAFFGSVMRLDTPSKLSGSTRTRITRLQRAARQFMKTARLLPHDYKAELRLRRCERQFEECCNNALAALHAT